jgi:hypothetical protein
VSALRGARRLRNLAALAAASMAALCAAAANGEKPTMSDPKSAFAQALGASPQAISEFLAVSVPAAAPATALWLGSTMVDGEPQTWALAACGAKPCPGKPLSLPAASALAVAAVVDLQGAPFKLDLRQLPREPARAQPLPQKPKKGAVLVRASRKLDSGEQRDTLIIVSATKSPEILWQETAASALADGKGFQSLELAFAKPARGPWLELALLQHAFGGRGQPPGPPLTLQFEFKQGAYQRTR